MKILSFIFIFLLSACNSEKLGSGFLSGNGGSLPLGPGAPAGGPFGDLPAGLPLSSQEDHYFIAQLGGSPILVAYVESSGRVYKVGRLPEGSNVKSIASFDGDIYLALEEQGDLSSHGGSEIWKFNPQNKSLSVAFDVNSRGNSNPDFLTVYKNELYFRADNGSQGRELMKYSKAGGVSLVSDLESGSASSSPAQLTVVGDRLYFTATVSGSVRLYSYNGSSVQAIGGNHKLPKYLTEYNGSLYFTGSNGALYRAGQTSSTRVAALYTNDRSDIKWLESFNGKLYFSAMSSTRTGVELYSYDGSGTSLVADIAAGSRSSKPSYLKATSEHLYFQADSGDGPELFIMDKSESLSSQEIESGSDGSYPQDFFLIDGKIKFSAFTKSNGFELWQAEGGNASLWFDIKPGQGSSYPEVPGIL